MQVFSTDRAGGSFGGQLKGLRLANQDLPFFRPLIRRMKVGEVLTAEVPAKQAFGTNTPDARVIPADGKTVWLLELESINEIPAFVMPTADQLKTTASGLQYQMLEEGSGKKPGPGSVVEVHYTGYLTDGTIFDSSHARGTPAQFPVGGVIRGWTEGLQLMKEGGVYRFVIPAKLAYGSEQRGAFIKPNSTLVFLVKLVKVVR